MDIIKVQVNFNYIDKKYGQYSDTLNFGWDEYQKLLPTDIDVLKQKRINAWLNNLQNPLPPQQPTKADLQTVLDSLKAQEVDLQNQINSM